MFGGPNSGSVMTWRKKINNVNGLTWSAMTYQSMSHGGTKKTNDSQSNPLDFFIVWNHCLFLMAFFMFDFLGVENLQFQIIFQEKRKRDPKRPSRVSTFTQGVQPRPAKSPASWASKFVWYRHSPPLAPFGSTSYACSCSAPHLGFGFWVTRLESCLFFGGKKVLLTWRQDHHSPRAKC